MSIKDLINNLEKNKEIFSNEDYELVLNVFKKYDVEKKIDFEDEIKKLEQATNLQKEGTALFKQEQYEEAILKYSEAIELDSENKVLYSNRSACYAKLKRDSEGIKDAEKAIEIDPTYSKAYSRLGTFYFYSNPQKSLENFQKALENDPSNSEYKKMVNKLNKTSNSHSPSPSPSPQMDNSDLQSQINAFMKNPEMMKMAQDFMKNKSPEEIEEMRRNFSGMMNKKNQK